MISFHKSLLQKIQVEHNPKTFGLIPLSKIRSNEIMTDNSNPDIDNMFLKITGYYDARIIFRQYAIFRVLVSRFLLTAFNMLPQSELFLESQTTYNYLTNKLSTVKLFVECCNNFNLVQLNPYLKLHDLS